MGTSTDGPQPGDIYRHPKGERLTVLAVDSNNITFQLENGRTRTVSWLAWIHIAAVPTE